LISFKFGRYEKSVGMGFFNLKGQ